MPGADAPAPAGHVESLAAAIGKLPCFSEEAAGPVLSAVASPTYRTNAGRILDPWGTASDVPVLALALALRAASSVRAEATQEEMVEVVWTGPTSHKIPVRRTREVLLELIGLATQRLTVESFAAYKVPEVLAELTRAAAQGADVRLILETADDSGGRLSHDAAEAFDSLRKYDRVLSLVIGQVRVRPEHHRRLEARPLLPTVARRSSRA